jgi:hypothetical protein
MENISHVLLCVMFNVSAGGQEVVVRGCVYDRETACVPQTVHTSVRDVFCDTCDYDGCNSAHSVTPATLTALLSATLWAMAAKFL